MIYLLDIKIGMKYVVIMNVLLMVNFVKYIKNNNASQSLIHPFRPRPIRHDSLF